MTTMYSVDAILRRNIAALELELQRQRERADKAETELAAERKRLDWALGKTAYYEKQWHRLWIDVGTGRHKWFAVEIDNPRAIIDELIAAEAGEKK